MTMLEIDGYGDRSWRARWRAMRDLLGGALILAVWLGLWAWVAVGVGAPLSHVRGEPVGPAAAATLPERA